MIKRSAVMRRAKSVRSPPAIIIPAQNPRRSDVKRGLSFRHVGRTRTNDPEPMHEYHGNSSSSGERRKRRSLYYDEQRAATSKLSHPQHFDFDALTIPETPTTVTRSTKSSTTTGKTKQALAKLKNMFKA